MFETKSVNQTILYIANEWTTLFQMSHGLSSG